MPAFNIDTLEVLAAVEKAVKKTQLPCIVQLSEGEDEFVGAEKLYLLVKKCQLEGLPIYLNMDHGKNTGRLEWLAELGFDMVHFDGSNLEYETNKKMTGALAAILRAKRPEIVIEGEFNKIRPVEAEGGEEQLTDPEKANEFASLTGVDLVAVSVGNMHGVKAAGSEILDIKLLERIASRLPEKKMMTLHGGSGIEMDQIRLAIDLGVVKININTDLRRAFQLSLRQALETTKTEKMYEYFKPGVEAMAVTAEAKLKQFAGLG